MLVRHELFEKLKYEREIFEPNFVLEQHYIKVQEIYIDPSYLEFQKQSSCF